MPQPAHMTGRTLLGGFQLQLRVIGALMMRELHTRYGREGIGFAWFIGEPMVFTFGVVALWSTTRGSVEHGISVIAFVITGYTPLVMWRHCFAQSVSALKSNGGLLYHKQITFLDIILTRCALEIAGSVLTFAISILVFAALLGLVKGPHGDPTLLVSGFLLFAWFCIATALIVAPVTELFHTAEKLAQIVGYIFIPLSGAFWMVDWLPGWIQKYVVMMPSVSGYEMMRAGYFGNDVKSIYDPVIPMFVCAVMTLFGLLIMRRARNQLAVE